MQLEIKDRNRIIYAFGLIFYLAVILYFLLFGFDRANLAYEETVFSFSFRGIPLWFPESLRPGRIDDWIFSMGNLLAFIPFGVLIPVNVSEKNRTYLKCACLFLIGITCLETLQAVTRRGSFDIEDIVVNFLGFTVGYAAWRISRHLQNHVLKVSVFLGCSLIGVLMLIVIAGVMNPFFW